MKLMNPRVHSISRSLVVVVDIQQKLVPVIPDRESIISSTRLLLDVAAVLNVPAIATEQYPKGLGLTVSELSEHPALKSTIEKLRFSACEAIQQSSLLGSVIDRHVVLTGIETHICILQTAMDLLELGLAINKAECKGEAPRINAFVCSCPSPSVRTIEPNVRYRIRY